MNILTCVIENVAADLLATEIRFNVASARAAGYSLICFLLEPGREREEKHCQAIYKNLRSMKKEGRLDFFTTYKEFESGSTGASYLTNKFSEITDITKLPNFLLIIKL